MSLPAQRSTEEDDQVAGLGQPLPVLRSKIHPFPGQPRRSFDEKGLFDLADAIHQEGQKTPVRVCKSSEQPGHFILIGGERRWRAFGIIASRTGKDPIMKCFIDAIHDEKHHFREAFLDNLQREDLIEVDEAAGYRRLYNDSTLSSHSAKVAEIAKLAKKSVSHVDNYLLLDELPDKVKALMSHQRKENRLAVTSAVDIARSIPASAPDLRLELALEAIDRSLSVMDARQLIERKASVHGYGVGSATRSTRDDYRSLTRFLTRTLSDAERINEKIDFEDVFDHHSDDERVRAADALRVQYIIDELEKTKNKLVEIKGKIETPSK